MEYQSLVKVVSRQSWKKQKVTPPFTETVIEVYFKFSELIASSKELTESAANLSPVQGYRKGKMFFFHPRPYDIKKEIGTTHQRISSHFEEFRRSINWTREYTFFNMLPKK